MIFLTKHPFDVNKGKTRSAILIMASIWQSLKVIIKIADILIIDFFTKTIIDTINSFIEVLNEPVVWT
ncbi:MAG: hypothetical protein B1H12_00795 [Desulfobacteraceae bacterium 4484_190.2]|nr:MAG: hypothetical protein B1H12_00795 [Desulfobacteraceae bacterium 4484_190.2]